MSLTGERRVLGLLAGSMLAVMALAAACGGGGEGEPASEFFSRAEETMRRFVPEARALNLRLFEEDSGLLMDLIISTELEGEPRMHLVSDEDAVKGAEPAEAYEGFSVFQQKATFWADLTAGEDPLFAGTPSEQGLRTYLDFFRSGRSELTDERFLEAFSFAGDLIDREISDVPTLLVVDFDGEFQPEAAGVRIEATVGERRLYVGVLYEREDGGANGGGLDEAAGAFAQRFALPDGAEEEPANPDWDFEHRIWFADLAPE